MAVLPTPASPTSSGLFFLRRARIWMIRATSFSRPTSGSMRRLRASSFRLTVYAFSGSLAGLGAASRSVSAPPPPRASAWSSLSLETPCDDVRGDVEARDALLLQNRDGIRVPLVEHGDENVRARHLFFAARLDARARAAKRAVNPERGRRLHRTVLGQGLDLLREEHVELLLQDLRVAAGMTHDVRRGFVEQKRIEQVLDRDVLVVPAGRVICRDLQRNLDLGADSHPSLFVGVSLGVV